MALDARTRSSIYRKLSEVLGEPDANALMSQFPSIEADDLVTKQFLRAELAEVRNEVAERFHRQTLWLVGAVASSTSLLAAIGLFA